MSEDFKNMAQTVLAGVAEIERLREAICIYMREEADISELTILDWEEGKPDECAIDWFCDQYSERNYE